MYSARYSCQILKKLEFFRQIFEKSSKIKFHENPSSGSRVGRTDKKLIVAFRNLGNAPKKDFFQSSEKHIHHTSEGKQ